MASSIMKCKHLLDDDGDPTGIVMTARGVAAWPSLFRPSLPKGETDQSKAKYNVSLFFPAGSDLSVLQEIAEEAWADLPAKARKDAEAKGKKRLPLLETKSYYPQAAEEYPHFIRVASNYKPDVVDAVRDEVDPDDTDMVYTGRYMRATVNAYSWDHPTGGLGVSFGLNNVQILNGDTKINVGRGGGNAKDQFEIEDDDLEDLEG